MTFTYTGALTTDLEKVRFYVGDITSGSGVRPSGANFTDEELTGLLTIEGSWGRAVAGVLETLANEYAKLVDLTLGPRREAFGQAAARYADLAAKWREDWGNANTSGKTAGFHAVTRVDGYSQDVSSDEV